MTELNDVYSDFLNSNPPTPPANTQLELELGFDPTNVSTPTVNSPSSEPVDGKANVSGSEEITTAKPEASEPEGEDWSSFIEDLPQSTTAPEAKPTVDWSELGKAIKIDSEVKGQDDVVKYIDGLKSTIETLKTKSIDETIPTDLVEAIEIAKNGGDYYSYLGISDIDYTQEDPVAIFEDEVAELFYNDDGSFRQEEFDEYIEAIPDVEKKMKGRQIQRELIALQDQQKNALKQKVAQQKLENLNKLEKSLARFDKVDNFVVTPKVKQQLFDELATGKFMEQLGISSNGNHNWDKLLNTYFKARYFDAVQKFNSKAVINQERRTTMNELTNPSIKGAPRPENAVQSAKKTGVDLYLSQFQ